MINNKHVNLLLQVTLLEHNSLYILTRPLKRGHLASIVKIDCTTNPFFLYTRDL